MGWFTVALVVVASACFTLAGIHAHVWLREPTGRANAAFALLAASVGVMAFIELQMLRSDTSAQLGRLLWWNHIPIWLAFVSVVAFVRLHLRAGRAWLGWTAIGLRTLALVINFFSTPNINYSEIVALQRITVFGEVLSFAEGTTNPLLAIAQAGLFALIVFVTDAAVTAWRNGERRRAWTIGGSLVFFVSVGAGLAIASYWGLAKIPVLASLFFLPIVLFMGYELSLDLIRSVRLAAELEAKTVALRGSEQKLAFAAEAASAGLWSVDRTSGRLWATPQALSMFGMKPDSEHYADELLRSVHPEDLARVHEFIHGEHATESRASVEYRVVAPNGEVRWFGARGGSHEDGRATSRSLMGATIDITDRKRAEEETARQRVELEHLARVATVSELSGALAHELNQPLAIIMSNAEAAQQLLQRREPDLDEVRAILVDIVDADERAGEVIRRLRGMLKRGVPQRQPLSLADVVRGVLQFMRADLVRRGVALDAQLPEGTTKVSADRVPIEQVLINIITNACDSMAANTDGDRRLTVSLCEDAAMACVRIEDVGGGLPTAPERVFDAFYTTKSEGLGMGLAISRSIVTAHGGRLTAEPNRPRGAVFTVCLPFAEAAT
ncbi:MAG TPA: ATP-binding protein [Burkholderiaceae bacterium]|nr:ATP-binding protein [Burkholderiaceae bacterium]